MPYVLFLAAPWWVGPIVVVLVYALFTFGVPALLGAMASNGGENPGFEVMHKTFRQVWGGASMRVAPWAAGLVFMVWIASLLAKMSRRTLLDNSKDIESIRALSWRNFELLIGEYYRRQRYSVEERGGPSPDGGVDLALRKDSTTVLVQCKHWKTYKVGVKLVRELLGAMTAQKAHGGVLVTGMLLSLFDCSRVLFRPRKRGWGKGFN